MNHGVLAWLLVSVSVVSEVAGTLALKHSQGFTKIVPSAVSACSYILAIWLMSLAMRQLEMGITYAVWAASGAAITAALGIAVYGESATASKLIGLVLVVLGVFLLSLQSSDG
jgi:small multidrug resistance pump